MCSQQVNLRKEEEGKGGKGVGRVGDIIMAGGDEVEGEMFFYMELRVVGIFVSL